MSILETALAAERAGCSVVPAKMDGSKRPDGTWKHRQSVRATAAELQALFDDGRRTGLGVICGAVSGNLEMLEFEGRAVAEGLLEQFDAAATEAGVIDVLERIVAGYCERTPSGGIHLLYRCDEIEHNQPLAQRPATVEDLAERPDDPLKVLIETRGEGGFVVTAPSHGTVHPSGEPWELTDGGFDTIATITPDERRRLFDVARSFDVAPEAKQTTEPPRVKATRIDDFPDDSRPGDEFNAVNTCTDVLERSGFVRKAQDDSGTHYTRPGKDVRSGSSATVWSDDGTCTLFSTSIAAPTEYIGNRNLKPWQLHVALNYGGDHSRAASEWRAEHPRTRSEPTTPAADRAKSTTMVEWLLPESFWSERPEFQHIWTAGRSRLISPDSVFACVLTRCVALTHHQLVLPAIVGSVSSLNLFAAIVAPSGSGKGASANIAAELVPAPLVLDGTLAGRLREMTAGSGEGMVGAFFERDTEKGEDGKHRVVMRRSGWNALVRIDEGRTLTQLAARRDQTTVTTLCRAWSGEELGATYADREKNLKLPALDYRLCLTVGIQPTLARDLLADTAGGTPQRFVWINARAVDLPDDDDCPPWPGPLPWSPPRRLAAASGLTPLAVAPEIVRELRQDHRDRQTGKVETDDYSGHAGLRRLKVAAALAVLAGRLDISTDDWRLAGVVEATSTAVRKRIEADIRIEERKRQDALDDLSVRRQEKIAGALEAREAQAVERVAKGIVRRARKVGAEITRSEVSRSVAGKYRAHLTAALELALSSGWLTGPDAGPYMLGEHAQEVDDAA